MLAMYSRDDIFGEVFNVGTGTAHSIMNIAQNIKRAWSHIPPRPAELSHARANIDKITKLIGWSPTVDLMEYLHDNNL